MIKRPRDLETSEVDVLLRLDVEDPERSDGQRPNRQVRAVAAAELFPDRGAEWTGQITEKYVRGGGQHLTRLRITSAKPIAESD